MPRLRISKITKDKEYYKKLFKNIIYELENKVKIRNHETDEYTKFIKKNEPNILYPWKGRYMVLIITNNDIKLHMQVNFCETCGNIDDDSIDNLLDIIKCKCIN